MPLECEQPLSHSGPRREVIGCEHLSLNDREVDLDLIQLLGMNRSMHEDGVRPLKAQAVYRLPAARRPEQLSVIRETRRAEQQGSCFVTSPHERIIRSNAVLRFAAAEPPGAVHVPGRQVGGVDPPLRQPINP